MDTNLQELYEACVADIEAGLRHDCKTTPECCLLGGCPKCGMAVMRGVTVGVERITVNRQTGVARLTIEAGHGQPCVVTFAGIEVVIE